MRVGIDVSPLTAQRTGVGYYTYSLLKHLLLERVRQEADITFHGFSSGLREIELAWMYGPTAQRGGAALDSWRHISVPTRLLYRCWNMLGRPRVDRILEGLDIYHATNYFMPPAESARRVVTLYDLSFLRNPAWCSPKIVGPFSRSVARFARESDAVVTCSEHTKRDVTELLGIPPEKVTVAYGAVDEDLRPVPRPKAVDLLAQRYGIRQPFLLFVSTLEPRKNVEGLLRAFAQITDDVPHTLVLAGGDGWGAQAVSETLARLDLGARVHRTGYIEARADLPAFYAAAEVLVFPSFYEGFGLPVLEAMTFGCPVITSSTSSLPEVGGDAAQYVNPDDIDGMAATMRMVLLNERLRETMSAKGLEQAKRFTWQACAGKTLGVYRSLV